MKQGSVCVCVCVYPRTHTPSISLSKGSEWRGLPRARGTIAFLVNYDRLADWKAGSQREGAMERGRYGR